MSFNHDQLVQNIYNSIETAAYSHINEMNTEPNDKIYQEKRMDLYKSLSPAERETLLKVMKYVSGERAKFKGDELKNLGAALSNMSSIGIKKSSPSNSVTELVKGMGNRLGTRVSSKHLENQYIETTLKSIGKDVSEKKMKSDQAIEKLDGLRVYDNPKVLFAKAMLAIDDRNFDQNEALENLRAAAKAGLPEACYALAKRRGTPKKEILDLFKQAALNGNADAQYELGVHYQKEQNYQEAEKWLKKAAKQGNPDAMTSLIDLGKKYKDGDGIKKNRRKAHDIFDYVGRKGSISAALELIVMYKELNYLKTKQAKEWIEFAALIPEGRKKLDNLEVPYKNKGQNISN